ncbi:unnamed protein product [Rhizoctonia solani]|uniref:Uncharacterized protein n=1 Tax=Rhizoctonia solani TaxID=456999 RepID=A0A8H3HVC3_9AGAM|nr:unnamed protein product [Rhizoctonia solani]
MYNDSYSEGVRGAQGNEESNNIGSSPLENVWNKESRIMIGIDIGSTQSGVAVAFLQKGVKQTIHRVTQWPGQALEHQSKIPTLVWYDKHGRPMSFGAEAIAQQARENAEDNDWTLAKRFKLHLHPPEMRAKHSIKLEPLPNGVTLSGIYADFMKYLFEHTVPFFKARIVDGPTIWEAYKNTAVIVIGHPNGWSIREQDFLRKAAIEGGLRLRCISALLTAIFQADFKLGQILPCATQGSTVDTTIYSIVETKPFLELAEKRDSACVQAGGLYVDDAVERYLEDILTRAGMNAEDIKEYVQEGVNDFEGAPKRLFANGSESLKLKLGDRSLTNADINVRRGVMTIQNPTPKRFFDYCVKAIIKSLDDQVKGANVSHILLVGGFGDSPFLQSQLREHFQPGIQLTTANDYTSKAVAEGAIMWNTMTSVFTRAPNWSYGIQGYVRFDSYSSDHRERTTFTTPDGYEKVNGVWCEIVKKGVPLNVNAVCRQSFFRTYSTPHPNLESIEIALFSYSGNDQPKWLRSKGGSLLRGFENVCLITADLRSLGGALEAKIGPRGTYWGLLFWVCVRFGDTEISAYLEWEEASGGGKSFPIVMLVMGLSGSGKSSLINRATGQTDFSRINDCELRFIDTPGFGNDMIDDRKVIEQLVEYFATPIVRHDGANLPRRLTGLLYIHSEDGSFKGRTSRKTIEFLVKVLGEQFLDRVTVLVQTQNEAPSDLAKTTQSRESPLYPLYRHNTKPWATVPYPQDLQSIERILESYITLQERLVRPAVADKFFSSRASNNWQYDNISRHLKEMFPDDVGQVAIADQAEVQLEAPPPERTDELEKAHTLIAKKEQELKDLQSTHENELKSLQEQNKAEKSNLELQLSSLCQTIRDREVEISKFQSRQGPELEETGALKEVSSKKDSEIQLLRAGLEAKDEELTKIKENNERAIRESMEKLQAKEREITELKSRNPGTINKTTNSKRQGDEIEYLKAELRRIDAEYGSLRTHMQLEENTSQADIMTALGDINRLTEEFGQTISEHVEKHMEDNPPEKAFQPKDLLCIFGQVKSNVASKIKLDAYLFLDVRKVLEHTKSPMRVANLTATKYNNIHDVVIGIDIGSTQSGVAYAFLQQGAKQTIHRVTQWPGQESQNLHGKIPTVLWYDSNNKAVSFGAEALTPQAEEEAEDHGWKLAKYFKLHLHPPHLTAQHGLELEPLPFTVPLSQIYSDFLGYLLQHTKSYFEDHIIDGRRIWNQYKSTMEVVLAHPNGWGIREQAFLRLSAVKAGFTNANDAATRVHFVNEAEASVHFCALYSDIGSQLKLGTTFAVCDAGGSTVDTTVYAVRGANPLRLEETRASDCVQAGALFIDKSAEKYLRKIFKEAGLSEEDIEEYATRGVKDFELHSKRGFKDATTDPSIEIAGTRYNNTAIRARRGRITFQGSEMKAFFDTCADKILESVSSQLRGGSVSHILLVGGFGESPYLRERLKERFGSTGCDVTTTSERTSKAVADGTIIWYSSNNVVKRTPWYSYGIEILIPHDARANAQKGRQIVRWPTGSFVKGGWSQIVPGGVPVDCETVSRRPYYREYTTPNPPLNNFAEDIWCYTLKGVPQWMRFKPDRLEEEGTAASPTELQRPPTPGQQPNSPTRDRSQKRTPVIDIMRDSWAQWVGKVLANQYD